MEEGRTNACRRAGGFSLPEVLVVISIIVILAGLLFPVFSEARVSAKSTSCASNIGSLVKGVFLYASDYDDRFPAGKDCLDKYSAVGYSAEGLAKLRAEPLIPVVLDPYVRSADLYKCPLDSGLAVVESDFPTAATLTPTAFSACGMSYEYHTALGIEAVQLSSLTNPASVVLLEDAAGHWHGFEPKADVKDDHASFAAKTRGYRYNIGFTDGHVKNVDYDVKESAWRAG